MDIYGNDSSRKFDFLVEFYRGCDIIIIYSNSFNMLIIILLINFWRIIVVFREVWSFWLYI